MYLRLISDEKPFPVLQRFKKVNKLGSNFVEEKQLNGT